MIPEFERLSTAEIELMLKAPLLVCILIAGADDNIDRRELKRAVELVDLRQRKVKNSPVAGFYTLVVEDLEDKLKVVIQSYPVDTIRRNAMIISELERLNNLLPRFSKPFAIAFYQSIKKLAIGIAESSGGLLGIQSVGEEEARLVDLAMVKDPSRYAK